MNFGGPIDLTPFGGLVRGIGFLYWAVALGAAGLALWLPKRWIVKKPLAALVLAGFIYPIATRVSEMKQSQEVRRIKLDESMALFEERCETAGEKINRTVENVDGVVWMKWRDPISNADNFVETIDPKDGRWYRYFGAMKLPSSWTAEGIAKLKREEGKDPPSFSYRVSFEREPIDKPTARYGITWDDLSTREDREHWIAGGSLKVIDLQSNEVIAERRGFMVDRGQGSQAGGRSPWLFALRNACPEFSKYPDGSHVTRSYPLTETIYLASSRARSTQHG